MSRSRGFALLLVAALAAGCGVADEDAGDGPGPTGASAPARSDRAAPAEAPLDRTDRTAATPVAAEVAARSAASPTAQPVAGSAQREAILNALRPAVEEALRGPVEFVVSAMRVEDGWALVIAEPQRPGGAPIDAAAIYPDAWQDMDGLTVTAILRHGGGGDGWTLADHAIGATDVWQCGVDGPPPSLTGC